MALIICPECGRKVSSMAAACPDCGFPVSSLQTEGEVRVKVAKGFAGKVTIFDLETEEVFWQGKNETVATFTIKKPTEIGVVWGIGSIKKAKKRPDTIPHIVVNAGKRYMLKFKTGMIFESVYPEIFEVDVIDS